MASETLKDLVKALTKEDTILEAESSKVEERIRRIVREELAAWEKKQVQARRFGIPAKAEVK